MKSKQREPHPTLDSFTFNTDGTNDALTIDQISAIKKILITNKKIQSTSEYSKFLIQAFPLLISTLKSTSEGTVRLLACDTISVWTLRSQQITVNDPQFYTTLQQLVDVEVLAYLFAYIVDYWNETGAALSNSLKDLFAKLVSLVKTYEYSQQVFQSWIDKTLQVPLERRVRYYLIEVLTREVHDSSYVLAKDPEFISKSLKFINNNSIGNGVGHAIVSVLQALYTDEEQAAEWYAQYWDPVKLALNSKDQELKKGVKKNLLPELLKISKKAFGLLISEFKNLEDEDFYIYLLTIGQQLLIEEEPFPTILPRESIQKLLTQDRHKIEIFKLLTYSAKGSKPISPETLILLKDNLDQFFADVEVETRMQFLSMFKQFLYRLKDSAYAQHRDATRWLKKNFTEQAEPLLVQVEHAKYFIQWLLKFVKNQLRPGSQYQRVISSLVVLKDILESSLDESIPFDVKIPYPFHFAIFDDEMVRLLFDTILSTYDDIRTLSSGLLLSSKLHFDQTQRDRLVERGFYMLEDYTTCDSGAKLLELAYNLFGGDISIFNRLVETIPLNDNIFEAVKRPIDGHFNALSLILKHFSSYNEPEKIIDIVVKNWSNVKEILSHDSPEGCDMYGVGSAQLVLSYGWRSTKESTILINELLRFDLSSENLLKIGELTLDQLSTVRHRGAFSSVYPTFITLATVAKNKLPGQNKKWLDFNISLIQTKTQLITRRSGGLPYLITAILTVEGDLFQVAFDKLLEIASVPVDENEEESEKMDIPQVHAFNCIKHLFIESQLSAACSPFIYKALELSLSTFSSKIWSVRNCSIMLFTALQNRLFGRKKMSARVFFSRFKGIKSILMDILSQSISNQSSEHLESLFPVLTVLSKLESTPGYDGLSEFKPLLRACLKAKVWKIRESASRALPALVSGEASDESMYLLNNCGLKDQNQLHGHLLAIGVLSSYTVDFANALYARVGELLLGNPCYATRKVYVQLVSAVFEKYGKHDQLLKIFTDLFTKDNSVYEIDGSKQLYLQDLSKLVISHVDNNAELLEISLTSNYYEVQLEAINFIESNRIESHNKSLTQIARSDNEWTYVRSKAIPLVDDYPISQIFQFSTEQSQYGEDIKRSALELLGSAIAKDQSSSSSENLVKYLDLLKLNSHEDQPFPIRVSVLASALRYLSVDPSNIEIKWIIYNFLTDDDEEIRQMAADYFQDGATPLSISNSTWIVENFGKDPRSSKILLSEVLGFDPKFDFKSDGEVEKVLFVTEKGNFYRNGIDQFVQLSEMVKVHWDLFQDSERELIVKHAQSLVSKFTSFVELHSKEDDDVLGWCTDEEVFADVYSVLYLAGAIDGVDLTALKKLNVKIHPSLQVLF